MLTKTDLSQIKGVVREEVETAVENKLEPIKKELFGLTQGVSDLQNSISELDARMKNVKIRLDDVGDKVNNVQKDVSHIRKTVDIVIKNYDEGDVLLDRRVKKIGEHLNINQN